MIRVCTACLTAHDEDYTGPQCRWCGLPLPDLGPSANPLSPIDPNAEWETIPLARRPCTAAREIYGVTNTAYCQLIEGHAGEHEFEEYVERKASNPFPKPCPSEVEIEPGGGTLPCVFDEHHLGPHEHGSIVWTDDESSADTAALPNPRDKE